MYARCWSRLPLAMAEECGWRRTWSEVRCRKVFKQPASMATHHVDRAGENNAAWTKATPIVLVGTTALAEQVG
jgi:hypothetical protein